MSNVKFILDADEAKAVRGFLKVVDSQRKVEKQFGATNRKLNEQNRGHQKAGKAGVVSVAKLVASWISVGTAISGATALLQKHNDTQVKSADRAKTARFSLGQLSQLAGGDQSEYARMISASKKTSAEAGIDLAPAADLQFQLESFGIADQRKMFARLVGTVSDSGALAEAAVTMQSAFGADETGSIRDVINKGLAASSISKTTLNDMLTSMSQAAPSLNQIGASDEEGLAALAVLSKARKSSDIAATEIEAISAVLMKKGLSGHGLFRGIGMMREELVGKTDEERVAYFGRKEAFKGFQTLIASLPALASAYESVDAAQHALLARDRVRGAIDVRRYDVDVGAIESAARAEQGALQREMNVHGATELTEQRVISEARSAMLDRGDNGWQIAGRTMAMEMVKYFGGNDNMVAAVVGGKFKGRIGDESSIRESNRREAQMMVSSGQASTMAEALRKVAEAWEKFETNENAGVE